MGKFYTIDYSKKTDHEMTKKAFEAMLMKKFDGDVKADRIKEEGRGEDAGTFQTLTLYYVRGGHVGTWVSKKRCWAWAATEAEEPQPSAPA